MSKRKGGWEKKEADKRPASGDAVVAKTLSITSFFTGTDATAANSNESTETSSNSFVPTLVPHSPNNDSYTYTAVGGASTLVDQVTDPALVPFEHGDSIDTVNTGNRVSAEFSSDPGLWDLTSSTFRDL